MEAETCRTSNCVPRARVTGIVSYIALWKLSCIVLDQGKRDLSFPGPRSYISIGALILGLLLCCTTFIIYYHHHQKPAYCCETNGPKDRAIFCCPFRLAPTFLLAIIICLPSWHCHQRIRMLRMHTSTTTNNPNNDLSVKDLLALDRRHVWHPYSSRPGAYDCLPIASASGVYLHVLQDDTETKPLQLVDGMSSWWAAIHGYHHPHLNAAIETQLAKHVARHVGRFDARSRRDAGGALGPAHQTGARVLLRFGQRGGGSGHESGAAVLAASRPK